MKSMTPEEERWERIERTLEFLAASQAQLSASSQTHAGMIAKNTRLIAENSEQLARNSEQISKNSEQISRNSEQISRNSEQIGELMGLTLRIGRIVEEQARRLDVSGSETDRRIKALAELQKRTDDRLGALINIAERYFSNGRH